MPTPSLLLAALLLLPGVTSRERPTAPPSLPSDTTALTRLVGRWLGSGVGPTGVIRDTLTFAPALGGRALRFTMESGTGDGFAAEGYVWSTGAARVELIETSSADPMRRFRGTNEPNGLVLVEEPPERTTTVRLDFLGSDSLRLQEISTRGQPPRAFVDEMFTRIGR